MRCCTTEMLWDVRGRGTVCDDKGLLHGRRNKTTTWFVEVLSSLGGRHNVCHETTCMRVHARRPPRSCGRRNRLHRTCPWKEVKGLYVSRLRTQDSTHQHMREQWQSSFNKYRVTERISETLVRTGRKTSHARNNVSTPASTHASNYAALPTYVHVPRIIVDSILQDLPL